MSNEIFSVSEVTEQIMDMFQSNTLLNGITVEGEVSNFKDHSSGHIYFKIKDQTSVLPCMLSRSYRLSGLKCKMTEGSKVRVTGTVRIYAAGGYYQLYATRVESSGMGNLYERYLLLKNELQERGMFDPMYKQSLPKYIHKLGVVTAPTGAVIRDIITVTQRRNPYIQIVLYPAIVQGQEAPASIVRGIRAMTEYGVDTLIVGRGGGSIEDLWAFNEEAVAQAIFDCPIPVISAVGHETNTTIADFVADRRAATPSEAAELAVFDIAEFENYLSEKENALTFGMEHKLMALRSKYQNLEKQLAILSPTARIRDRKKESARLEENLSLAMAEIIRRRKLELSDLSRELPALMDQRLQRDRHRLERAAASLDGLSPLKRLQSGYSFTEKESGVPVRSIRDVQPGDDLKIHVADGQIQARVTDTKESGISV